MKTKQILTNSLAILALGVTLFSTQPARSADVSPRGVNVKSFGTTTVFLTYFGLNNQTPADALWCGEINADRSCVKLMTGDKPAPAVFTGSTLPQFGAQISYNGTGRLKGRWEVVLPGDPPPTGRDLLTEASLPLEERGLQRRYTQLERFDVFLQPTGQVLLPGPDPTRFPKGATGAYQILLRIEATDDKEGDSSIGTGIVNSGGVAGFPMPVFRYFMTANTDELTPIAPLTDRKIAVGQILQFSWQGISNARGYKLEIKDKDRTILSALLSAERTTYTAPPWLKQKTNKSLTWQVQALDRNGSILTESIPQQFQILGK